MRRIVQAAISAASPTGETGRYFAKERCWEAPMRSVFSRIPVEISNDQESARSLSVVTLIMMGKYYYAIYPTTKIAYPVFFDCMYETINKLGWWTTSAPSLFNSGSVDVVEIAEAVQEILAAFARKKDHRNYSLLTKWLHFCFPETFAIYDQQAAKSISTCMFTATLKLDPSRFVREQFHFEALSDTTGTGYVGVLRFYRLLWETACSAGLNANLQNVADQNQLLIRMEPGCSGARVTTLDIIDKLLWKADGSRQKLGLDSP